MPANLVRGPDGEKAWERAKEIVREQYGDIEKSDKDRFYALVTTVYKSICKSPDYNCRVGEDIRPGTMGELIERLARIGQGDVRRLAAYDFGSFVRNFAGELAMKTAAKGEPEHEIVRGDPKVKRLLSDALKVLEKLSRAIYGTEAFLDITPPTRGYLDARAREGMIDEKAQPKLNKYDPGSLLGWCVHLLDKEGLDDAAAEVRRVSRVVSQASTTPP